MLIRLSAQLLLALLMQTPQGSWRQPLIGATSNLMKKSAQERCKHCMLAVVRWSQKFSPTTDPLAGGAGQPKFNQLEMVTIFTYKPSLVKIDAHSFELSW